MLRVLDSDIIFATRSEISSAIVCGDEVETFREAVVGLAKAEAKLVTRRQCAQSVDHPELRLLCLFYYHNHTTFDNTLALVS